MKDILVSVWCRTSEQLGLESTSTTVEVDEASNQLIIYTEKFRMYLGDIENRIRSYSSLLEITCVASKFTPTINAKVTFQSWMQNEVDALRLANSINKNSSCAVSIPEVGKFQVNSGISFVGYFDVDDAEFDYAIPQEEAAMNMFADLLSTALILYRCSKENRLLQIHCGSGKYI